MSTLHLFRQLYVRLPRLAAALALGSAAIFYAGSVTVSGQVPAPRSVLGFHPTDDRTIADWGQITGYFNRLDKASDRVLVREIGRSTNGKPLIVAFISAKDNIKKLDKYRQISAKLADPRTITSP